MLKEHHKFDLFGKPAIQKIRLTPPFKYDFPVAKQACFLYILKGEAVYELNEEPLKITSSYSLLLNCIDAGKSIREASPDDDCEILIITFYPEILKKIYQRELPQLLQNPVQLISNKPSLRIGNELFIKQYIDSLLYYFLDMTLVHEDILVLKLKEILLLLLQTSNAETIRHIISQIFAPTRYNFRQIIDAHIFNGTTIDELAQLTNKSMSSFKREFARVYDDTPANYIRSKRLEKAAELLKISDKGVSDIAFECGFSDVANFSKSFKDKYNVTPTTYRSKK